MKHFVLSHCAQRLPDAALALRPLSWHRSPLAVVVGPVNDQRRTHLDGPNCSPSTGRGHLSCCFCRPKPDRCSSRPCLGRPSRSRSVPEFQAVVSAGVNDIQRPLPSRRQPGLIGGSRQAGCPPPRALDEAMAPDSPGGGDGTRLKPECDGVVDNPV
jgi:hypothetical protein